MKIQLLVVDGVFDVGLSIVLDTVGMANELIAAHALPVAPLHVSLVGTKRKVRSAHG